MKGSCALASAFALTLGAATANASNETVNTSDATGNTSNETMNTSNESSNTSDVTGNTSNQTMKTSNESSNTSDMTGNTSNEIVNTSNESSNTSDVTGNAPNETVNTSNESSNTSDVTRNALNETVNTSSESSNTTNMTENISNETVNTSSESLNTSNAAGKTSNATGNTSNETLNLTNETLSSTDTTRTVVDVQGQSGKFTVYDERSGRGSGIQVTMDALREVDADGFAVGASGSVKHSIQTFAAQDFTIASAEDVTLGDNNVSAVKISFSSPISSVGKIRVDTYVLGKSGSLGPPGETWAVQAGDLKWNIELSDWSWCGCRKGQKVEEGTFIDLDISIKGLGDAKAKGDSNKSISLGGGVTLELSNQVYADGNWSSMPQGYPKVSMQGASTTFRFPRFTVSSLYDPVLTGLSVSADSTTASASSTTASASSTTASAGSTTASAGSTTASADSTTNGPSSLISGSAGLQDTLRKAAIVAAGAMSAWVH
eukprot:TRINITY_DN11403_c0_g1_i2.p1 TRINITY_DN11403_c0_g1~~TRINITY_DN11403_c0_g1_i2.p1  ORF type:complete len:489 (+),score=98.29 TRINITY_DN11403_c0_g1_i2:50-1516(+)